MIYTTSDKGRERLRGKGDKIKLIGFRFERKRSYRLQEIMKKARRSINCKPLEGMMIGGVDFVD